MYFASLTKIRQKSVTAFVDDSSKFSPLMDNVPKWSETL